MKLRLLSCLLLLCLSPNCFAELTLYQQDVVATFAREGTDKPLREAYAAEAAGKATPAQRQVIRTSEMIHEDMKLAACLSPALGTELTFEGAIDKVIAAGQGAALLADAKKLFGQGEWEAGVQATAPVSEQVLQAAALLGSGSKVDVAESPAALRALQRRMTLNYYMAYATDGKCKASSQLRALLGKGSK